MSKKKAIKEIDSVGKRVGIAPTKHYLSSGCTLLDLAISGTYPGGFPGGRISHIYGLESTAKTVFMTEPLGAAQRGGGKAIYVDVEGTCDFDRLPLFGVTLPEDPFQETDSWAYTNAATIEELFENVIARYVEEVDPSKPNVIGIDSLSALPSEKEQEDVLGKSSYGTSRAKMLSTAFRKFLGPISKANLSLIFIDQSRQNIGVFFGPSEVVSGGKALGFYTSVQVHMSKGTKIKATNDTITGMRFGFDITKNKVAKPFRAADVNLLFDYGIDDVASNIEWLKEQNSSADTVKAKCTSCTYELEVQKTTRKPKCNVCGADMKKTRKSGSYEFLGQKFGSLGKAIAWVEENEKEKELAALVAEIWDIVNATPERAMKKRD